ncbi:uncharacterized protein LOC135198027 [Macrobrachium nipponense]|uniref:uncharacterized protein LOC135198027 n=1 Tax=Macrobrachium nipponense TaxID=159736 RepID=UPI0030C7D9AF
MIVTPTYSREMGEGGRLLPAARVPTLGLPDPNPAPTYKSDVGVFKTAAMGVSGAYDHNKNTLSDKEGGSGGSLGGHPLSHQLPAFTAPWLAEVAHITPARPSDHLAYPQPPPIPDYYPHYPTLPHRPTGYYHHHFLPPGAPPHFMRDYPRHAPRPYPPLDPRPTLERPTPVSGAASLGRPLGPPPLRGIHPDPRDLRDVPPSKMRPRPPDLTLPSSPGASSGEPSPRGPHGEPSPKRRSGSGSFPMPAPRSPRAGHRAPPGSSLSVPGVGGVTTSSPGILATAPTTTQSRPLASGPILSAPVPNPDTTQPSTSASPTAPSAGHEENRPSSPYHAHFARGALVTVGTSVRRVEDLETRDFLEAAREAEDLKLDPSTVAAIISTPSNPTSSTITFIFPSRNTQVSVEASLDHPFFVFHCGWSSCSPELTEKKYDLKVRKLQVGDVCVSLTKKVPEPQPPQPSNLPTLPPPPPATTASPTSPAAVTGPSSAAVASGSGGSSGVPDSVPSTTTADSVSQPSTSSSSSSSSNSSASPTHKHQQPQQLSPTGSKVGSPATTTKGSGSQPLPPLPGEASISSSSSSTPAASGIWNKPAAIRGSERQHSSDEAQRDEKDSGRKRRWSDPGQVT